MVIEPIDWEARLKDAVEATLREKARRKAEREEFQRRRDHGLARRYAAKSARIRQAENEENQP